MGAKQRLRAERRRAATAEHQNLSVKFSVSDDPEETGIDVDLNAPDDADDGHQVDAVHEEDEQHAAGGAVEVETDHEDDDGEDPLALLQKQHDDLRAKNEAYERQLKERADAEARFRADADRERQEREAAEAKWRDERKKQAEYRGTAEKDQLFSHKAVLEQALENHDTAIVNLRRAKTEARANLDYAAEDEIDEKLSEVRLARQRLREGHSLIQERIDNYAPPQIEEDPEPAPRPQYEPQRQPQQVDGFETAIAGYGENDKRWLRLHRADLEGNQERAQELEAIANYAVKRLKLAPGSNELYAYLDQEMGYATASADDEGEPEPTPAPRQNGQRAISKRPTAAPGSRSTSSGAPQKVFLSEWDMEQAKAIGMSFKDYAEIKRNANKDQLTMAQAGGRMTARYIAST